MSGLLHTLYERARAARHNRLHLNAFRMRYLPSRRPPAWRMTDGRVELILDRYPYHPCHDIEGYLQGGARGGIRPQPGETVVDAGGCFGEFTIFAAKCVGPTGRVLMLEPDPRNLDVARHLLKLNGDPPNVTLVPAGLWNSRTTLRFRAGRDATSSVLADDADVPAGDVIEIPTHSLASLADAYQLDRLDLVKMDVEGAELQAVDGLADLPAAMRPRLAIASYHWVTDERDGRRTWQLLEPRLRSFGYAVETGFPGHLTTWAWPGEA